jgi:hypothetical protein
MWPYWNRGKTRYRNWHNWHWNQLAIPNISLDIDEKHFFFYICLAPGIRLYTDRRIPKWTIQSGMVLKAHVMRLSRLLRRVGGRRNSA